MTTQKSPVSVAIQWLGEGPPQWPAYQTPQAAGMDLQAHLQEAVTLEPGKRITIPTGLAIALPAELEAQVRPRSGLALRYGVTVLNSPGTIDADYRGEIKVILIHLGEQPLTIQPGDRIAQLVIAPVARVDWAPTKELPETARGAGGFGSTGQ